MELWGSGGGSAIQVLAGRHQARTGMLDLAQLARLLHLSAGTASPQAIKSFIGAQRSPSSQLSRFRPNTIE